MLTITGNGRITRDVALRTDSGETVATISVASDRRHPNARQQPVVEAP